VYPSEVFDPTAIVDTVVAERCTALHGVPTHFLGVIAEVERRKQSGNKPDMSTLRSVPSSSMSTSIHGDPLSPVELGSPLALLFLLI